jgi:hypothetical protein
MGCTPAITFPGSVDPRLRPPQHIGVPTGGVIAYPVPVYVPVYPEETYAVQPTPVAIVEPEEPPAPTIFERRSRVVRYEEPISERREPALPEPAPVKEVAPEPPQPQVATVLVYRDGRQLEVRNYAIVGDTLYAFGDAVSRKILLADLDLGATVRLNEERGVDFNVPGPRPKHTTSPPVAAPATTLRAAP